MKRTLAIIMSMILILSLSFTAIAAEMDNSANDYENPELSLDYNETEDFTQNNDETEAQDNLSDTETLIDETESTAAADSQEDGSEESSEENSAELDDQTTADEADSQQEISSDETTEPEGTESDAAEPETSENETFAEQTETTSEQTSETSSEETTEEETTTSDKTLEELLDATFEDINDGDIFDVQDRRGTCTLVSVTMLMRRAALLSGDPYWYEITQDDVCYNSGAWDEDIGLYCNFDYKGISIRYAYLPTGSENESILIKLLAQHPEGIVLYRSARVSDAPHAVLLTDYTNGQFYCSDPAYGNTPGKEPIEDAYSVSITNADAYWYVSSPTCTFDGVRNGYLSITGEIDGVPNSYFKKAATMDVYIDGKKVQSGVDHFLAYYPEGTKYTIKNITLKDGYDYNGLVSGTLSGTIKASGNDVVLNFQTKEDIYFNDFKGLSAPFVNAIKWAVASGVANGYSDTYFGQAECCTRKQFVTMLYRFAGKPEVYGNLKFKDCNYTSGSDTYNAILWATKKGIISGYDDNTFRPNNSVTRKQAMIMLYRFAGSPNVNGSMTFTDCKKYSKNSDSYKAIIWGVAAGLTEGTNGGKTFSPDSSCLRRHAVLFLFKFNGLY